MKVRHKQHPDVMVDLDASTRAHWLAGLSKDAWELAPEDRWQDVTGECSLRMDGTTQLVDHDSVWGAVAQANPTAPYRLRKVQVYPYQQPTEIKWWAFLIERKEP